MQILLTVLAFTLLVAIPKVAGAQAVQHVDCGTQVKTTQSAIDQATEDMKGMENMPKDQLGQVNKLLNDAKTLAEGARRLCSKSRNDDERAQASAQAKTARRTAEDADILHWEFMRAKPGMKGMKTSSDQPGMDMPGMKK